jgi:hypothetical protein
MTGEQPKRTLAHFVVPRSPDDVTYCRCFTFSRY